MLDTGGDSGYYGDSLTYNIAVWAFVTASAQCIDLVSYLDGVLEKFDFGKLEMLSGYFQLQPTVPTD